MVVLVLTDKFTKLSHAFPCVNQTGKQVAQKPVNVMFKQVLKDPVTVDYNFTTTTLHEAADIAQKHAVQEQKHQTQMYNRKGNGVHLNCGPYCLLF